MSRRRHSCHSGVLVGVLTIEIAALLGVATAGVLLRWQSALASAALLLPAAVSIGIELDARVRYAYRQTRPPRSALGTNLAASVVALALAVVAVVQLTVVLVECATGDGTATGDQTDVLYVTLLCNDELPVAIGVTMAVYLVAVAEAVRVGLYGQILARRQRR